MVVTFTGNRHGHGGYKTRKMLWSGVMLTAYLSCFVLAPGSDESTVGVNYQKGVSVLKESAVWK